MSATESFMGTMIVCTGILGADWYTLKNAGCFCNCTRLDYALGCPC